MIQTPPQKIVQFLDAWKLINETKGEINKQLMFQWLQAPTSSLGPTLFLPAPQILCLIIIGKGIN